eukprot:3189570-Amphidinium_carterae.1
MVAKATVSTEGLGYRPGTNGNCSAVADEADGPYLTASQYAPSLAETEIARSLTVEFVSCLFWGRAQGREGLPRCMAT